jgi:hypothetical protein
MSGLTTVEVSAPGDAYTLTQAGPTLVVHLAGPGATGGVGPCICGFNRFARDVGFSVGGGVSGPGYTHLPCPECAALAGEDNQIGGMHRAMFARPAPSGEAAEPTTTDGSAT